jgi:hypothetical protein
MNFEKYNAHFDEHTTLKEYVKIEHIASGLILREMDESCISADNTNNVEDSYIFPFLNKKLLHSYNLNLKKATKDLHTKTNKKVIMGDYVINNDLNSNSIDYQKQMVLYDVKNYLNIPRKLVKDFEDIPNLSPTNFSKTSEPNSFILDIFKLEEVRKILELKYPKDKEMFDKLNLAMKSIKKNMKEGVVNGKKVKDKNGDNVCKNTRSKDKKKDKDFRNIIINTDIAIDLIKCFEFGYSYIFLEDLNINIEKNILNIYKNEFNEEVGKLSSIDFDKIRKNLDKSDSVIIKSFQKKGYIYFNILENSNNILYSFSFRDNNNGNVCAINNDYFKVKKEFDKKQIFDLYHNKTLSIFNLEEKFLHAWDMLHKKYSDISEFSSFQIKNEIIKLYFDDYFNFNKILTQNTEEGIKGEEDIENGETPLIKSYNHELLKDLIYNRLGKDLNPSFYKKIEKKTNIIRYKKNNSKEKQYFYKKNINTKKKTNKLS